jgi:hypothetical protein
VAGYDSPLAGAALRWIAGAPRVEDAAVDGVPAAVYRPPRGRGPWPGVVVFPGVTRRGRAHEAFRGLGRALAATGHLAVVAEPQGAATGELTPETVRQALAAAEATSARGDVYGGRVGLAGVSGGATLVLLVAGDTGLSLRISIAVALAPCCDIREAMRVVTSGFYKEDERLRPFSAGDFFKLVIARSVAGWLPPGPDRDALRDHLQSLPDYGPEPLAAVRSWPRANLGVDAALAVELLGNEDPARFDSLYAALPDELRQAVTTLSPSAVADRITAPVELVVARDDKYIPHADALAFAGRCPSARLTVLESLSHAVPRLSFSAATDLARLDGVLVRLLTAVRAPSYSRP